MEYFKQVFKNLGGFVGRMTPSQVMMLFGVVAGTIVGVIFLTGWVSQVTYSSLYSNLDEAEAGEVVTYLSDNKIPYEISAMTAARFVYPRILSIRRACRWPPKGCRAAQVRSAIPSSTRTISG